MKCDLGNTTVLSNCQNEFNHQSIALAIKPLFPCLVFVLLSINTEMRSRKVQKSGSRLLQFNYTKCVLNKILDSKQANVTVGKQFSYKIRIFQFFLSLFSLKSHEHNSAMFFRLEYFWIWCKNSLTNEASEWAKKEILANRCPSRTQRQHKGGYANYTVVRQNLRQKNCKKK